MNDQKLDEVISALDPLFDMAGVTEAIYAHADETKAQNELLSRIADALDRLAPPPATTSAYDDHNLVVDGKGE